MVDMCLYPIMTGPGKWEVVLVDKKTYGYAHTKYGLFDTEADAWKRADELNEDMGILRKECMGIVGQNMKLPHAEDDCLEDEEAAMTKAVI